MRFIEAAVLQIELEEEGPADGRPLLLHGWPDAPRGWRVLGANAAKGLIVVGLGTGHSFVE